MVHADPRTADVATLADYVARWLDGLRDWCPRCDGVGRDNPRDPDSLRGSCPRCRGKLWVAAIDVERVLEAIAAVGPAAVEITYPGAGVRRCTLRLHGDHCGEDDTTTGAVYRAAAALVAALVHQGVLRDHPMDMNGH